ncbi:MAG TPA: DUF6152 family protein [Gammaproteobacteria bacterium]
MVKTKLATLGTLVAVLASASVSAHHGASSVYLMDQSVTKTGIVTDYQFINPHVLVFFEVEDDSGEKTVWSAGLTSPNRLARSDGWSVSTLKQGDEVTVVGAPARGNAPSIWVEQVMLNGEALLGGPQPTR